MEDLLHRWSLVDAPDHFFHAYDSYDAILSKQRHSVFCGRRADIRAYVCIGLGELVDTVDILSPKGRLRLLDLREEPYEADHHGSARDSFVDWAFENLDCHISMRQADIWSIIESVDGLDGWIQHLRIGGYEPCLEIGIAYWNQNTTVESSISLDIPPSRTTDSGEDDEEEEEGEDDEFGMQDI